MGFWGALWDIGKAVVKGAWNGVKRLFGFGEETAEEISQYDSYDRENASAQEHRRINESLAEFKNNAAPQAEKLENDISDTVSEKFDDILDKIEEINHKSYASLPLKLPTRQIKAENRRILRNIRGKLKNELMPKISIDNSECNMILKLPAGDEKRQKMLAFINNSLKDSVKALKRSTDDDMRTCVENIHEKLENRLDDMQDRAKRDLDTLMQLKNSEGKEAQEKEKSQIQLISQMWLMQNASNLLQDSKLA